ncbi:MAG: CRISPR system precrRNA processing endoribonuclease RAMP protein Cas6 [Deltaproteobacteria bacterium]|nr:CRISPR system precrRNA processing endoribonuclease RAMP protein Cas6 [Deltaproteobacteria bacterium]
MLYGAYHFHSVFQNDASLPEYKGSTLRGALGVALKKIVCALKRQDCPDCLLRSACIYFKIFESTELDSNTLPPAKAITPTHPFVIQPPLTTSRVFHPYEPFDFTLLLFGPANDYLPYFVYAVELMGESGLGRRQKEGRGAFQLLNITKNGEDIFDPELNRMNFSPPEHILPDYFSAEECSRLTIELKTPLRLKYRSGYLDRLPFHHLIRAGLRRARALNILFGRGDPDLDYRGLISRAEAISTVDSNLHWHDWERYSNRQQRRMKLGGLVGRITYEGPLGEFMPLIRYAERVHLGKGTSFGLGWVTILTNEPQKDVRPADSGEF